MELIYFKKNIYSITFLISSKYIPRIHLILNIVQAGVISVSYYRLTLRLECSKVVHHPAAEEGAAVFQCGFVYYYFSPFCLDTLHYALYRALAEIVTV